jgi:hypothetical protein
MPPRATHKQETPFLHANLRSALLVVGLLSIVAVVYLASSHLMDTSDAMGGSSSSNAHAPPAAQPADGGQGHGHGKGLFTTEPFQHLIGLKVVDTKAGDEIPADRSGEDTEWIDIQKFVTGRRNPTRVLKPGAMATMDYSERRLNMHLDKDHKISSLTMG